MSVMAMIQQQYANKGVDPKTLYIEGFAYRFNIAQITANQQGATDSINIDANSDFIITKSMFFANETGDPNPQRSTQPVPTLELNMTDTASSGNLFGDFVPLSTIAGSGDFPYVWPFPRMVQGNGTLRLTVNNLTATVYDNFYLVLGGARVFRASQ